MRLIALACYAPLSWRPKYLASAVILGPFTLDRPVIAVLANHTFQSIAGSEKLSDPDREKLMTGGLYLRIAARSRNADNLRIAVKMPNRN